MNATNQTQPVDGFRVTLNEDTGVLRIVVPDDFVFPVGWKLTVTTDLIYQVGLTPGTAVVNDVTATSDRLFDTCTHTLNNKANGPTTNVVAVHVDHHDGAECGVADPRGQVGARRRCGRPGRRSG